MYFQSQKPCCSIALLAFALLSVAKTEAANWSITPSNTTVLDTSSVFFAVEEMSGVAHLGPSPVPGQHRFLTVQDDGTGVVAFDAAFDLSGNLVSAVALSELALNPGLDQEGIAIVSEMVFVGDENGPGVRQFDLATGSQVQNVDIPSVFANRRSNRGFESLAYDEPNSRLWTANEEALTVDGPASTTSAGTTVRLLELPLEGNTVTAGQQFAYEVEPIHGLAISGARSGLADLVVLPDGSLLALERSAAGALPGILNSIYEIDFTDATDISTDQFDDGLDGEIFAPVKKQLLWSGGVASDFTGSNLEGLTVGPQLPNGDWVLLGVVDNGGSGANTIASFVASPTIPIPLDEDSADFDTDGIVNGADFLTWQRGEGARTLAAPEHGDANRDGLVDDDDLTIWQTQFSSSTITTINVPEPSAFALISLSCLFVGLIRQKSRSKC